MGDETPQRGPGRKRPPNPLRELSEQDVLEAVFHHGPITRPEIAARTSLSKATVGTVVERLERLGMLEATGRMRGSRGRSPITYAVRDTAGFVLGIDIGGANIRAGAADIFGELIHDERHGTTKDGSRAVSAQVMEIASSVIDQAKGTHERLLSAGISTPGVVDQTSRRVVSLAYNVSPDGGLDPLAAVGSRWGVPVLIENNVNLAAVGESWHGIAHGVQTFAFVSVGAGVGLGLVINGELVRGAHGAAGEIAYLPSGSDPFNERHRLHGGLEDEIGADAILAAFEQHEARSVQVPATPHDVFKLAQTGDPSARDVLDTVVRRLGAAIASVVSVIDPELVVLGGGIGANPSLLAPVRATVAELVPLSPRIETSTLGERTALSGAIALALREARAQLFTRGAR